MKHKTRWLAVLAAVLMALSAGYEWRYRSRPAAPSARSEALSEAQADPVTQFRTQREQLRQKQRAELNDIIHDSDTDAATLSLAQQRLLALMDSETAEVTLEGLLSARGFEGALVSVNGGAVYVMVRGEALNQRQTAVILDLALRETGVTAGNVKIVAIN